MKEPYETIGNCFLELARCMDESKAPKRSRSKKTETNPQQEDVKETVSFTELRAFLADISRSGKTKEVRDIILSYGKEKLSDIEPSDYESLMEKAKELADV